MCELIVLLSCLGAYWTWSFAISCSISSDATHHYSNCRKEHACSQAHAFMSSSSMSPQPQVAQVFGCRRLRDSRACKTCQTLLGWVNKIMPPPTVASLSGLVVGCVPFLKNAMIPAQSAPLGFIMTALDTISGAFVYLISFILGAVLQKGPGDGTRLVGWGSILMTVLNRFLIMPVLGEHHKWMHG